MAAIEASASHRSLRLGKSCRPARQAWVVTFSWDFNPNGFQEAVIEQAQANVRSKLNMAGLSNLAVSFQKGVDGKTTIYVSGSEEDVAKAKKILGV